MKAAIQTLLPFLKLYRWRIVLVFTSVIVVTAAGLLAPWLIRDLVRVLRLAEGDLAAAQQGVILLAVFLFVTYGVRSFGQYLNVHHSHVVAWNVCHDLRTALYKQLQRFSPAYYAERQTGEVVSRVIKDTDYLEPIIADAVYDFLVSVLLSVGVFIILLLIDPILTLITFLPMPFVVIAILILRRPAVRIFKAEAKDMGEVSALVQDNIAGIRDIQIYTREDREFERVSNLLKRLTRHQIRARQYLAGMFPLIEGSTGLSMVLAIGFGGMGVLNGTLAIEDLVAFLLYVTSFYLPLWRLATVSEQIERGVASLGRINEVLSATPSVDDPVDGVELGRAQGSLTLEKVSFAYLEEDVLRDVTLNRKNVSACWSNRCRQKYSGWPSIALL